MSIVVRAALSALVFGLDGLALRAAPADTWAAAESGRIAADQLNGPASAAVETALAATTLNGSGLPLGLLTLVALAAIWGLGRRRSSAPLIGLALALPLGIAGTDPARAYYDTRDYPEYIEILPNQTAFLIPEVGDNKEGQASFMSEGYLKERKVALKRVQIPHSIIRNPGWAYDYFVPAARLLVVDRSPVSREWVTDAGRGTTARDQGFRFETAESVSLSTGVVISAFVKEEDAARFVYWFGARSDPRQDLSDPKVNFASVIYGKSLADVIDDNVHRTVQAALAKEFGRRSTDDAIRQKADIIEAVEKEVRRIFEPMGLTITTLGYAESLSFDNKDVQRAINQTFIAIKNAQSAQAQITTLPIQEKLLALEIRRMDAQARAKLAERWNGSAAGVIPSAVLVPGDLLSALREWWSPAPLAVPAEASRR